MAADKDKKKKITTLSAIMLFFALMALTAFLLRKPLSRLISEPELIGAFVKAHPVISRIGFVVAFSLQIVLAFIPGEPFEIAAGFAFGPVEGTLLCLLSTTLGGTAVFLLVKKYGMRIAEIFFPREKLESLSFVKTSKKRDAIMFLIFFVPGTPKDLLTYFAGLTDISILKWMIMTSLARFPSVVTSTVGGDAIGEKKFMFALIVFAATFAVSAAGYWWYSSVIKKNSENKSVL